jgi:hypothetical protein
VRGFGFDRNWLGLGGSYVGGWRRGVINVTLLYFGVGLGGVESLLCRLGLLVYLKAVWPKMMRCVQGLELHLGSDTLNRV